MMGDMEVLIVYGSTKGRTARIAAILERTLIDGGITAVSKNVFAARPGELSLYPYVVLGSSTYGQGDLQQDFLEFELGMDDLDLTGCRAAVFGSGNSRYTYFAEAVDILEAKLNLLGARLLIPGLRQNMMTQSPNGTEVHQWAMELTAAIVEDRERLRRRGRG